MEWKCNWKCVKENNKKIKYNVKKMPGWNQSDGKNKTKRSKEGQDRKEKGGGNAQKKERKKKKSMKCKGHDKRNDMKEGKSKEKRKLGCIWEWKIERKVKWITRENEKGSEKERRKREKWRNDAQDTGNGN